MLKNANLALIDELGVQFNRVTLKLSNDVYKFETSFDKFIETESNKNNRGAVGSAFDVNSIGKFYSNSAKNSNKTKEKIKYPQSNNNGYGVNNVSTNNLSSLSKMKLSSSLKNLKTPFKIKYRPSSAKHSNNNTKGSRESPLPKLTFENQNLKGTPGFNTTNNNANKSKKEKPDIPKFKTTIRNDKGKVRMVENNNYMTDKTQNQSLNSSINTITLSENKTSQISNISLININNNNTSKQDLKKSFEFTFNASIMKEKLKQLKDFKTTTTNKNNPLNSPNKRKVLEFDLKKLKNMNFKLKKENLFEHLKKKSSQLDSTLNTTSNLNKYPSVSENNNNINVENRFSGIISDNNNRNNSIASPIQSDSTPINSNSNNNTGFNINLNTKPPKINFERLKIVPKGSNSNLLIGSTDKLVDKTEKYEKMDSGAIDVNISHEFRIETMSNSSKRNTPKIIKNHPSLKNFFEVG